MTPAIAKLVADIRWALSRAQVLLYARGFGQVVYFAHSKLDYHTVIAADAKAALRRARPGKRILDPSSFGAVWGDLVERLGSHEAVYQLVISCCTEVAALEHEGVIGRGVYLELVEAERQGRPRFVLRNDVLVPIVGVVVVDSNDFRRRYGRILTAKELHDVHVAA